MALSFQVLASGSKGNSILVWTPDTRVLVDAGLSAKEIGRRLEQTEVSARELDALVVSHEHQDHVRGVGVLSRRLGLPVCLSRGTLDHLPVQVGHLERHAVFQAGVPFQVGDLKFLPFPISHDAHDPMGFTIEYDGCKMGICTDLGVATHLVRERLQGCQGLIVEANHDRKLLLNGPYPPELKQRIQSRHGHLSNADACELLKSLCHSELQAVVMAHLSETNNRPDLVVECLEELRDESGWRSIRFEIGNQHRVGKAVTLA